MNCRALRRSLRPNFTGSRNLPNWRRAWGSQKPISATSKRKRNAAITMAASRSTTSPNWPRRQHRLHHALRRGEEMWASCWHAGFRIVDVSDLSRPKEIGGTNYHPLFPEPTHTVLPLLQRIGGRRIAVAIDEEDQAQS